MHPPVTTDFCGGTNEDLVVNTASTTVVVVNSGSSHLHHLVYLDTLKNCIALHCINSSTTHARMTLAFIKSNRDAIGSITIYQH